MELRSAQGEEVHRDVTEKTTKRSASRRKGERGQRTHVEITILRIPGLGTLKTSPWFSFEMVE
jgi:hypothetical protein